MFQHHARIRFYVQWPLDPFMYDVTIYDRTIQQNGEVIQKVKFVNRQIHHYF